MNISFCSILASCSSASIWLVETGEAGVEEEGLEELELEEEEEDEEEEEEEISSLYF
tara:strand:- start:211 stop:381 length:171 start_codon:yes stop_codon:yes gene_type:complete